MSERHLCLAWFYRHGAWIKIFDRKGWSTTMDIMYTTFKRFYKHGALKWYVKKREKGFGFLVMRSILLRNWLNKKDGWFVFVAIGSTKDFDGKAFKQKK